MFALILQLIHIILGLSLAITFIADVTLYYIYKGEMELVEEKFIIKLCKENKNEDF